MEWKTIQNRKPRREQSCERRVQNQEASPEVKQSEEVICEDEERAVAFDLLVVEAAILADKGREEPEHLLISEADRPEI